MSTRPQSERKQTSLEGPPIRYASVYAVSTAVKTITGATVATPIAITASGHGYTTGDFVKITGVVGNTAANGTWKVTVTDSNHFTLNGSTGVSSYVSGGEAVFAQPVQVKLLTWDESTADFATYGDPFRIGDVDTAGSVGDRILIIWNESSRRWLPIAGIANHYQLIRGVTVAAVTPTDDAFQLTSLVAFEEFARLPDAPIWVAPTPGGVTLTEGEVVWAVYHKAYTTYDPGGGEVDVDWLMLPTSAGSSTPPLRRFALTATKSIGEATATAKWLDNDGDTVGGDVTIHDARGQFSGRIENYISGERAFEGVALQRTDLGGEDAERWEIILIESFADWVHVVYDGEDTAWQLESFGGKGFPYHGRRPAEDDGEITIVDPLESLPEFPSTGEKALAVLVDPDTDPPTYQVRDSTIVEVVPGVVYTTLPVATEGIGAGGIDVIDPGNGTVKIYRQTTDPAVFANFDDPIGVENWSKVREFVVGEHILVARTREGHRFAIPLDVRDGASIFTALIDGEISAGSAGTPTAGTATIYSLGAGATTTSLGTRALYNPIPIRAKGSCACARFFTDPADSENDEYLITGPPLVECTTEVVDEVACVEGEVVGNKIDLVYAAVECPEEEE